MFFIQYLIHQLELASGARYVRYALAVFTFLFLLVAYDLRGYRNFSTQEAMDAAQVGRNLAEGRGYTTLFIRPFSMYLVRERNLKLNGVPPAGTIADYSRIRGPHPDISNPPVYPVVLAGLMRVLPFDFAASATRPFWSSNGHFMRYQPDFLITLFNEFLFAALVIVAMLWARRMFDIAVAWTSAGVLLGAELLWRFSSSGLSTMLLLLIFMGLVWCLTLLESEVEEPRRKPAAVFALAAAAGVLVGVGGLTRYAFAWLIIPTLLFFILLPDRRRGPLCLTVLAGFAVVMVPWLVRNYSLSGTLFGTGTYTMLESTAMFPRYRLERSLHPDVQFFMAPIWIKASLNLRALLPNLFTCLGGGWICGFFFVGLLVAFRSPRIRRFRYFLLFCLGLLIMVQVLGQTQISADSPDVNSENLLVLLLPLVVIYGVSFFFLLLDQINLPMRELRLPVIGLFGAVAWLPLVLTLMPPKTFPVAYPPYHPLVIQQTADWMKENELMMSDIPWAVAWYGDRQCVWLTLNATENPRNAESQENFFSINDYLKPISALYLTPRTLDSRFVSDWVRAGEASWGSFFIQTIVKNEVPANFPLRQMPTGYLPEQLFLSDWKRWRSSE